MHFYFYLFFYINSGFIYRFTKSSGERCSITSTDGMNEIDLIEMGARGKYRRHNNTRTQKRKNANEGFLFLEQVRSLSPLKLCHLIDQ